MKIVIQTLDFVIPGELESFIAESLKKLLRHPVSIVRAELILGEDPANVARPKFCNIRLITVGTGYLVAQHGASYEEAVTAATEELHKKLKKDTSNSLT